MTPADWLRLTIRRWWLIWALILLVPWAAMTGMNLAHWIFA